MEVYMKCKGPHSVYRENWKGNQVCVHIKSKSDSLSLLPVQPRSTETEGNSPAVGCLVFRKPLDSCCVLPPEVTREQRPSKGEQQSFATPCVVMCPPHAPALAHTHTHTQCLSSALKTAVSSCQAWFDEQIRAGLLFSDSFNRLHLLLQTEKQSGQCLKSLLQYLDHNSDFGFWKTKYIFC